MPQTATLSCFSLLLALSLLAYSVASLPTMPLQFTARLTITNHLIQEGSEYPAREQYREIWYDFPNLRAKVQSLDEEDAGKTWLRRYDENVEYVLKSKPFHQCQRAFLSELMPIPSFGYEEDFIPLDDEEVLIVTGDGTSTVRRNVKRWRKNEGKDSTHYLVLSFLADSLEPYDLTEWLSDDSFQQDLPLVSYTFTQFESTIPSTMAVFEEPEQAEACQDIAGGFPYLHLFHRFLRV
jgi:hypothetical protein